MPMIPTRTTSAILSLSRLSPLLVCLPPLPDRFGTTLLHFWSDSISPARQWDPSTQGTSASCNCRTLLQKGAKMNFYVGVNLQSPALAIKKGWNMRYHLPAHLSNHLPTQAAHMAAPKMTHVEGGRSSASFRPWKPFTRLASKGEFLITRGSRRCGIYDGPAEKLFGSGSRHSNLRLCSTVWKTWQQCSTNPSQIHQCTSICCNTKLINCLILGYENGKRIGHCKSKEARSQEALDQYGCFQKLGTPKSFILMSFPLFSPSIWGFCPAYFWFNTLISLFSTSWHSESPHPSPGCSPVISSRCHNVQQGARNLRLLQRGFGASQ